MNAKCLADYRGFPALSLVARTLKSENPALFAVKESGWIQPAALDLSREALVTSPGISPSSFSRHHGSALRLSPSVVRQRERES
jgi:hypothetical protein